MRMKNQRVVALAVGLTVLMSVGQAQAGVKIEKIVSTGDLAPGTNLTYSFLFAPVINDSGIITFEAHLQDSNLRYVSGSAWLGTPEALTPIAIGRQTIPGTSLTFNGYLPFPRTTAAGEVIFMDDVNNQSGILGSGLFQRDTGGTIHTLAMTGQTVAGLSDVYSWVNPVKATQSGLVVYEAGLNNDKNNSTSTDVGIFLYTTEGNNTQLITRLGATAPGTNSTFATLGSFKLTPSGYVTFRGNLETTPYLGTSDGPTRGTTTSPMYEGIWGGTAGNIQPIERLGDVAPGLPTGTTLGYTFGGYCINNAGQMVIPTTLISSGDTTPITHPSKFALWYRQTDGSLTSLFTTGDLAPGLSDGTTITAPNSTPVINARGQVVTWVGLTGPSVTSSNDSALFTGTPGNMKLLLREGDPLPGPEGTTFMYCNDVLINDNGDILIEAWVKGPNLGLGNFGLWMYRENVGFIPLLRTTDTIDLGNGDVRTIAGTYQYAPGIYPLGNQSTQDGFDLYFNDLDQVAVQLGFTDGSSAVIRLTALVPEPASLSLLALGLGGLMLRRRGQ